MTREGIPLDPFRDPGAYARLRAAWLADHPGEAFPGDTLYGWPPTRRRASGPVRAPAPEVPLPTALPAPAARRRVPWGWLAAGTAGVALGLVVYLGQLQGLGQAYRQLQADATALRQSDTPAPGASATPPTRAAASTARATPQAAPPIPAAVADYGTVLSGPVTAQGITFPAEIVGPSGHVQTTVLVDTGNRGPDGITAGTASAIGLAVVGHQWAAGAVGGWANQAVYSGFTIVPTGDVVAGSAGAIAVPQALQMNPGGPGNTVNLGQAFLAHARLVEENGRWWLGYNGTSPPARPAPSPPPSRATPPPSAPPPSHTTPPSFAKTYLPPPPRGSPTYVKALTMPDDAAPPFPGVWCSSPTVCPTDHQPRTDGHFSGWFDWYGRWVWVYEPPAPGYEATWAWGPGQPIQGSFPGSGPPWAGR